MIFQTFLKFFAYLKKSMRKISIIYIFVLFLVSLELYWRKKKNNRHI